MSIEPGTHTLGPDNATLWVHTGRRGAIAKVGHDLDIEVTSWSATIETEADGVAPRLSLTADARSLRVREGKGGAQSLGDDDREGIAKTIDEEVLEGTPIEFRSTTVAAGADGHTFDVQGELEMFGASRPVAFALNLDGDRLTGTAMLKQSDWGRKPYSTLFGTLKVADEVRIEVDGRLGGT
jgi:polyisoprenoid-binding protein YceI